MTAHWLEGMNPDWIVRSPKTLFRERRSPSLPEDIHLTPSQHYGVLPQVEYMAVTGSRVVLNLTGSDNMKHVEPDDFVIHLRSFQGGIEHSRLRGKVSNAYTVFTPTAELEPRFFRWVLKSPGFIQELQSTTNQLRDGQSIRFAEFASIRLPLPPLETQRRIAAFLDDQVTRIDQVIHLRKQHINLLKERFRSLVTEQVTGANPEVIPGTGARERVPLKYLAQFNERVLPDSTRADFAFRYVDISQVGAFGDMLLPEQETQFADAPSRARRLACPGDTIISTVRTYLRAIAIVPVSNDPLVFSTGFAVLHPRENIDARYLGWACRSDDFIDEVVARSTGMSYPAINSSDLSMISVRTPPLDTQQQIAGFLDDQNTTNNALIEAEERQIALLQERKRSLITAAVTGEFDVASAAARAATVAAEGVERNG